MSSSVIDVIAPMNEEGTKATVLRWGKNVGDAVLEHEALLELETDKVTVEVASPASGELMEILKGPDEEVLPGQLLARVRSAVEATAEPVDNRARAQPKAASTSPVASRPEGAARLSPAVRRLLARHGLAAADITGTGRDGRVTAQDVARRAAAASSAPAPATATPTDLRIPHTPIRRRIAEHMLRSLTEAPHVTTLFEADLTRVLAHRARHCADFEGQGAHLTLTAYFIAASARALRVHPQVNATFEKDALQLHSDANIGVGTALGEGGLIVPVLQRAQQLSLFETALRLGELVAQARAGRLVPSEVRGGTFTISNHGVGGSLLAAPIVINQPQVAILGVGKVERRVCVVGANDAEAIGVRSMCYLTLTIDHRAIDAFQANAFLSTVVATLEHWPQN